MDDLYYIWSNEHTAWWSPNSTGYTKSLTLAGLYPREEAIRICYNATHDWLRSSAPPNELPIPAKDIQECADGQI